MSTHASEERPLGARATLLVALSAALVYANALPNEFVWDDIQMIRDNEFLRDSRNLTRAFTLPYWDSAVPDANQYEYRPLLFASFVANHAAGGLRPWAFRGVNVALHAASAVLVAVLAAELGVGTAAAALAGLVFAVHPVHVEAVVWIVGRGELAAALFVLLGLVARARSDRGRRRALVFASWASLLVGMLFKESGGVLVPMVAAFVLAVETAGQPARTRLARVVGATLPYVAVVALYVAVRRAAIGAAPAFRDDVFFAGVGPLDVFLTMIKVTVHYARLLLAPVGLRAHYDVVDVPVPTSLADPVLLAGIAMHAVALALVARGLWRGSRLALAGALLYAGLLPYLHLIPFQWLMADRFLYVPSVGFALLAGEALAGLAPLAARWSGALPARIAATSVAVVVLGAGAALAIERNRDWADEITFFGLMVQQEPTLVGARIAYAKALSEANRDEEATRERTIALQLQGLAPPPPAR